MRDPQTAIAWIVGLGLGAQWLASRLRIPSILLLLPAGFLAGPGVTGLLDPDQLLGDLLLPLVSLAVALILFEGGLGLRFREIRQHAGILVRLLTVGAAVTWGLAAAAAHLLLGFDLRMALLLGAILVVSGPTVVIPLLRHIRPSGPAEPLLRWEAIVVDPIGATLALLVFQAFDARTADQATLATVVAVARTLGVGLGLGWTLAVAFSQVMRRAWLPDALHVPAALAMAIASFAASNALQHESGLLTVTVLGVVLANRRDLSVRHILEFKEHLGTFLVSVLFIVLSARLRPEDLARADAGILAFVAALVLLVRPLAVALSAGGSALSRADRLLLAAVNPRGIVAAAVSSVFALRLEAAGVVGAERLVPVVFLVIVGTVAVYGLGAPLLARVVGLAVPRPQGLLLAGALPWVRELAGCLRALGIPVLLVDTNREHVQDAHDAGLPAWCGSILDEGARDELDLRGIGRLLALTTNDEVNALAALRWGEAFGRSNTFQLPPTSADTGGEGIPRGWRGRRLFAEGANHRAIEARAARGDRVAALPPGVAPPAGSLALMVVSAKGSVVLATPDAPLRSGPGDRVLALLPRSP